MLKSQFLEENPILSILLNVPWYRLYSQNL